jgi:hypothetical protein
MEYHLSRYKVYRAMHDDGIRINRTMNTPNGELPNNIANPPLFANGANDEEIPIITIDHLQ